MVGSGSSLRYKLKEIAPAAATMGSLIVLWQVLTGIAGLGKATVASPAKIVAALSAEPSLYISNAWVTLRASLLAFLLAGSIGIVLAVLVVQVRLLEQTLYPLVLFLQVVPKVAIAPLLVLWIGFGAGPKIVLGTLVAVFPIVVDAVTGLRSADPLLLDLTRSLNGRTWQEYRWVRLPAALPSIFGGLRVGVTLAVIGVVIGEFVGSGEGLGYLILTGNAQFRVDMAFASLTLLTLLGAALYCVVATAERLVVPWHRPGRSGARLS